MTATKPMNHAHAFRSAIEAHDLEHATRVLQEYTSWFRSGPRSAEEIAFARNMFEWAIERTKAQQARMSEELTLLKSVFDAYGTSRRSLHTWELDA